MVATNDIRLVSSDLSANDAVAIGPLTYDAVVVYEEVSAYEDVVVYDDDCINKRSVNQKMGIKKRFPQLPDDIIKSSWSGIVSRTRNSSQIFEKIDQNVFVAGCYNGSGIGVGTLFGEQIAIKASNENSDEIKTIEARSKPTWLPPQPFLNLGVKTRLLYERLRAKTEI